ncbi:Transglycosylase SLT domain-containing protein [Streptomyces sp. 2231.1]|nr:Transglycosylase SLT domain-containing protein [Streptomyces sp. 2231.1]
MLRRPDAQAIAADTTARKVAEESARRKAAMDAVAKRKAAQKAVAEAKEHKVAHEAAGRSTARPSVPVPVPVSLPVQSSYTVARIQAMARQIVGASQFQCFSNIVTRESTWNYRALNPSGAYGLVQAYPGSKMAGAGADWRTNPATQIKWGLNYMNQATGSASHFLDPPALRPGQPAAERRGSNGEPPERGVHPLDRAARIPAVTSRGRTSSAGTGSGSLTAGRPVSTTSAVPGRAASSTTYPRVPRSVLDGHVPPRNTGPDPEPHAVDQLPPRPDGWPPDPRALRQQRLRHRPLFVREISPTHEPRSFTAQDPLSIHGLGVLITSVVNGAGVLIMAKTSGVVEVSKLHRTRRPSCPTVMPV